MTVRSSPHLRAGRVVVCELIVALDDEKRRLAYAVVEGSKRATCQQSPPSIPQQERLACLKPRQPRLLPGPVPPLLSRPNASDHLLTSYRSSSMGSRGTTWCSAPRTACSRFSQIHLPGLPGWRPSRRFALWAHRVA